MGPVLRSGSYERKGASWYYHGTETIRVVNVDKSPYGQQFYINLALALQALGPVRFPPEHHCDVRFRLEEFVPDRGRLERLLDFDDFEAGERVAAQAHEIADLVGTWGLR